MAWTTHQILYCARVAEAVLADGLPENAQTCMAKALTLADEPGFRHAYEWFRRDDLYWRLRAEENFAAITTLHAANEARDAELAAMWEQGSFPSMENINEVFRRLPFSNAEPWGQKGYAGFRASLAAAPRLPYYDDRVQAWFLDGVEVLR
jgi:hypothetical protein